MRRGIAKCREGKADSGTKEAILFLLNCWDLVYIKWLNPCSSLLCSCSSLLEELRPARTPNASTALAIQASAYNVHLSLTLSITPASPVLLTAPNALQQLAYNASLETIWTLVPIDASFARSAIACGATALIAWNARKIIFW